MTYATDGSYERFQNNSFQFLYLVYPQVLSNFYHKDLDKIIKLCCYWIRSTRSSEGIPRPPGWPQVSPMGSAPAADSPREIWRTVSRIYTVLFLSRVVKNTKFNQYLPVDLTSLNVSNSRSRKPVMFWRWRRHGVALWRHGAGAWHNFCS